ncbi:arginyl-tRNA-protein transferase 1-like protein [Sarcoptes scabiei]|uniref:Arginyl-tRNA-protein transferase 1-like protein n=1 Tax=Sarcoptes scabiei TaxID=52283 RepID=A0A132AE16_SARSC|nr:arginyl-tRNA-protein transferase 1-like protein [Sarcoptes scabiei]
MKKKFRRRIRLEDKLMKREHCSREEARKILLERSKSKQPGTKTLEDYLDEISESKQKETKHSFRTRFVRFDSDSNETKLLMRESFDVYRKYQSKIHKESEDEISLKSYRRFLIDGPLEVKFGAYHQHYYIDDRLIAVGVLDLLPECLSSVYFFYDPEFEFLNLGVYSALREIALVRRYRRLVPELRYYYMGYYIHRCPKMRYKVSSLSNCCG